MENNRRPIGEMVLSIVTGTFLFLATAAVVAWQNSRLTVLYDLSGVLEPATRIAQGDLPYLNFPFPYAPLTFVMQSWIIRLFGAVYWHHIAYCCIVAGLATVLAWRIINCLLKDRMPFPRTTSFILSLPLTILGVYCIFPHPFYDPDSITVVLLCVYRLLRLEQKGFPRVHTVLVGMLLVVPLFFKQNIGLAFLGGTGLALLFLIAAGLRRKETVRPYLLLILGMLAGLAVALTEIHLTVGIETYKYWTITFATLRRTPSLTDMLAVYQGWPLVLGSVLFLGGAFLMRQNAGVKRWPSVVSSILMAVPLIWPVIYLAIDQDPSERAERLTGIWPLVLIASFGLAYIFVRRSNGIAAAVPIILIATANGTFLSQQLWGSTYGMWPLLAVLFAIVLMLLVDREQRPRALEPLFLAAVFSMSLLVAGGFYVYSNERLDYVNFEDGEMHHSTLPQLAGMSMRGDWLPDFDELVRYTDENIPKEAGVLYLPGEDLFYYTTGRHPHFPVMLFDVTNNPLSPDEIRAGVLASDIEWIIVKNETEIEADSMIDSKTLIFDKLKPDFRSVESLNNYEIYKRRHADDPPDEPDDSSSDDDDSPSDDEGDN